MKEIQDYDGRRMFDELEVSDIVSVFTTRKVPVNYSRTGYGRRLPTEYMIKTTDGRKHRVYCTCYSNCGTLWIRYKGKEPCCESAMSYLPINKLEEK